MNTIKLETRNIAIRCFFRVEEEKNPKDEIIVEKGFERLVESIKKDLEPKNKEFNLDLYN